MTDLLWDCTGLCNNSLLPDILDVLSILASVVTRNRNTGWEVEISIVNRMPLSLAQKETVDSPISNHPRVPTTTRQTPLASLSVNSVTLPSLYDTYLYHVLEDFSRLADMRCVHPDSFSEVLRAVLSLPTLYP